MSSFYGYSGLGEGSGGSGEGLAGLTVDGRAVQIEDDKIRFQSDVDRFDYLTVGTRTANSTLGLNSVATGTSNTASGNFSSANGQQTVASQQCAHAEGNNTTASGFAAHAEGTSTVASNSQSHAEGFTTTASGYTSHAEGYGTTASTDYAHAEGLRTNAIGYGTHAEGVESEASGRYSHAENGYTTASAEYAHAEGYHTTASGAQSHAEGNNSMASGSSSHGEGRDTEASNEAGHAEGYATLSQGSAAHAEGKNTTASGQASHAEGYSSTTGSAGQFAHAEGWSTNASGTAAHAEGYNTSAFGEYSHVQGEGTGAASSSQHVSGRYNILDNNNRYAEIVGNGTGFSADTNFRSNARTLDWNGNAVYTGKVTAGIGPIQSMDLTTKLYVDNLVMNNMGSGSGEDTYRVDVLEHTITVPFNAGNFVNNGTPQRADFHSRYSRESITASYLSDDPSVPEKNYILDTVALKELFPYSFPFFQTGSIIYVTYHGNQITPGFLVNVELLSSPIEQQLKAIVAQSYFTSEPSNFNNYVGFFNIDFFLNPSKEQQSFNEYSGNFLASFLSVLMVYGSFDLPLRLTFNIEGHIVTKDILVTFILDYSDVNIKGTTDEETELVSADLLLVDKTKYIITQKPLNSITCSFFSFFQIPTSQSFEILFATASSDLNFEALISTFSQKGITLPEWFQIYPDTVYDISVANRYATVASCKANGANPSPSDSHPR